jgi:hypothetical protein
MRTENTVVKKTAKKQVPITLPEVMTKIYQPNRITQAQLPLTLMQSKIFAFVMLQLQEAIKASMNGSSYHQLELFAHPDCVKIPIPLGEITKNPSQYREVKKAIKDLAGVVVEVPYRDDKGVQMQRIAGLIRADIPNKATYSSLIHIEIEKRIAAVLIDIDKNNENKPINFTSYYYEIVAKSTSQYTPRIYPLISSWLKKGAFSISMDDLKNILSIPDKYPRFPDFKKNVLDLVQKDLFESSNCWFNCNQKDFKTVEKGKIMLNFKVITPEFKKELDKKDEYILGMLKLNYSFQPDQLDQIKLILQDVEVDRNGLLQKISEVDDFIYKNNLNYDKQPIENKNNYMLKALLRQYS